MTYTKHNFTDGQVLTHTALNEMDDQIALNETTAAGKQAAITSESKLSADLVADGSTNKVFTVTEQTKLTGIAPGAEVNVIASIKLSDSVSPLTPSSKTVTIPNATTSADGLMSSEDKTKIDGLVAVSGTNDGTNWQTITIGGTTKGIPSGSGASLHTYRL